MTQDEARRFIGAALDGAAGTWADFGAGSGTFTQALATMLGAQSKVVAVDRDPAALRPLERLRDRHDETRAEIVVTAGDFADPDQIPELHGLTLDGALFANALHFVPEPVVVLQRVGRYLRQGGCVVIIEYDRAAPNRWVPFPLPVTRLQDVSVRAGFTRAEVVARRPSRYQGVMYCAVARSRDQ